jgi:prepilin-type N-terminal cleavage/methylation domain-containing protein
MKTFTTKLRDENGFSLMELLVVLLVLGTISGAVLTQIGTIHQRARTEQVKVDNIQEARDFLDQFFRDINQIGYPNIRMVDTTTGPSWSPALASPPMNDNRLAMGLVSIDTNEIRFEGDTNGDGTVESVVFKLNGSGTCNLCLQRSQVDKVSGSPLSGQTQNWGTEVNDVISSPIFTYFKTDGTQVTGLPLDISTTSGAQTLHSQQQCG